MRKYLPVLRRTPLFQGLEDGAVLELLDCLGGRAAAFARGSEVLRAGEPARWIGCVLAGGVQVCREKADGVRVVMADLRPGGIFGEAYACAGVEALPVSVRTVEDSAVLLLDCRRLQSPCPKSCAAHRTVSANLTAVLARKNIALSENIRHLSGRTIRERLLSYLEARAQEAGSRSFTIPFDRQALADYLCADRSALSRELGRLRREGVLETEKNRFVFHGTPGGA